MNHFASSSFWAAYRELPQDIRDLADKNFALLNSDARHPSLHFKKVGKLWSARVGTNYRALAKEAPDGFVWFAIVPHKAYDRMI